MGYEDLPHESLMENPEAGAPFVWTEEAHSLYLTFLEEAFVNDLYLRHYCSPDVCGCSPPFPSSEHASTFAAAPQLPSSMVVTPQSKPADSRAEAKACRRGPRPSTKASSSKKKGKWPSQDAGFKNQQTFETSIVRQDNKFFLEHPGSSSSSDYVVPKGTQRASKRTRLKAQVDSTDRLGADQVVPADYDQS